MANFHFKDKSTCAAYFNIARDNVFKVFSDIELRVLGKGVTAENALDNNLQSLIQALIREKGIEINKEEFNTFLWKCVKDEFEIHNEDKSKASGLDSIKETLMRKLLFRHFPFLGPVMSGIVEKSVAQNYEVVDKKKDIRERKSGVVSDDAINHEASLLQCLAVLYIFALTLSDCRDYYTHHNPFNDQDKLARMYRRQQLIAQYLKNVFTASKRINKENHHRTTAEVSFIDSHAYKAVEKDGEKKWVSNLDFFLSIVGESFISNPSTDVYQQKVYIGEGEQRWTFEHHKDPQALSDFGVFYLCSFFISRHDTFLMIDQIGLFENSPWNSKGQLYIYSKDELFDILKKKGYQKYQEVLKQQEMLKGQPIDNTSEDTPENNFLREMFCIYRIRLPKGKRMDMYDTQATVALDILNELNRCPEVLYELISPDDQKDFQDTVKDSDENEPELAERKRYSDRFPYLALRAIDESGMLNTIRFQVELGNYRFCFYNKECIDGKTELRRLQKSLNGFGRLKEMEEKRKEIWTPSEDAIAQEENKLQRRIYRPEILEDDETELNLLKMVDDTKDSPAYITDTHAHYNIFNNRIGLYWETDKNGKDRVDAILKFPELKTKLNDKGQNKPDVEQVSPKCLLSVHDLPALLFLNYLDKEKKTEVEKVIKDKYQLLTNLFEELSQNGKANIQIDKDKKEINWCKGQKRLKASEVPEKLLIYFGYLPTSKAKSLKFFATNKVISRWERAVHRQEHLERAFDLIGRKKNGYGKKSFERISHAQMANQVIKSIMDWLPKDSVSRSKLTGLNYEKLRTFLSLFDGSGQYNQLTLLSILTNSCLIDEHPFLKEILESKPENIEQLFNRYFSKEEKYLDSFQDTDEDGYIILNTTDYSQLPFVHSDRARWNVQDEAYYRNVASEYLKDKPVLLPDGIFIEAIIKFLRKKPSMMDVLKDQASNNVSFLISKFFEKELDDNSQAFYFFKRNHEILTKLTGVREVSKKTGKKTDKFIAQYKDYEEIQNTWLKYGKEKRETILKERYEEDVKIIAENINLRDTIKNEQKESLKAKYEKDLELLPKKFADIRRKEHLIRRYKSQDMILFLTAKEMLSSIVSEEKQAESNKIAQLKLKDIFQRKNVQKKDEEGHAYLSLTGDYQFSYRVKWESGNSVIKYVVRITQNHLSMKNYGKLRRLLNDSNTSNRLYTLMLMLAQKHYQSIQKKEEKGMPVEITVEYNDITTDFAQFDQLRPDVFKSIHSLEKEGHELLGLTNPENYQKLQELNCDRKALIQKLGGIIYKKLQDENEKEKIVAQKDFNKVINKLKKREEYPGKLQAMLIEELGGIAYKNIGGERSENWSDEILKEYERVFVVDRTINFRSLIELIYKKDSEEVLTKLRNSFAHGSYINSEDINVKDVNVPNVAKVMSEQIGIQKKTGKKKEQK